MSAWVIRGLGMAVLHGAAITLLAKYAVYHPTDQTLVISLALAVLVGAAALWSALDAWRGLPDRGKVWFISALVAGPVAGILYVIGRAVFVDQTGVSELGGALTGGAAFSALLVLIPAGLGLFVGGRIGRSRPADEDDTDDEAREVPSPSPRPSRRVRPSEAEPTPRPRRRAQAADELTPQPARRVRPSGEAPSPRLSRRIQPRTGEPRA
jgi:phosphate/sulfate permease